jgi:hypothetical protein
MLQHCGHMLPQLFSTPHPKKTLIDRRTPLRSARNVSLAQNRVKFAAISQSSPGIYSVQIITTAGSLTEWNGSIVDIQQVRGQPPNVNIFASVTPSRIGSLLNIRNRLWVFAVTESGRFVQIDAKTGETHTLR